MDRDEVGHEVDDRAEARVGLLVQLSGPPAEHRALPPREGAGDRAEPDEPDEDHEPAGLPPCGQDREPELGDRSPAPGADPRADLEAVDVGSETWIANLALGGCAPFAIDGRQPELVAHALGLEQAARREPEGQRVAVVRDLEEAV